MARFKSGMMSGERSFWFCFVLDYRSEDRLLVTDILISLSSSLVEQKRVRGFTTIQTNSDRISISTCTVLHAYTHTLYLKVYSTLKSP